MLIIRDLRKERGLTLDQLAEKTGISKRSICMYEANESDIPYMRLKKIAEVLNVNLLEFDPDYHLVLEESNQSLPKTSLFIEAKKGKDVIKEESNTENLRIYLDRYFKLLEDDNNKKDRNSESIEFLKESFLNLEKRVNTLDEIIKSFGVMTTDHLKTNE